MLEEIFINYIASVLAGLTLGGGYILYKKSSLKQENTNGDNLSGSTQINKTTNINNFNINPGPSEQIIREITRKGN